MVRVRLRVGVGVGARVRGPEESPLVCAAADIVVADDHADVVGGGVLHHGGGVSAWGLGVRGEGLGVGVRG